MGTPMQTYSANTTYTGEHEKQISVSSNKCRYQVQINNEELRLIGPGVDESSDYENLPTFDNDEDMAIFAVMLFENGIWLES